MTDIDAISRIRYDGGVDPIEHAVFLLAIDMEIRDDVLIGDVLPGVPIAQLDQTYEAYARRMVAKLLNAGWTPPHVERAEGAS